MDAMASSPTERRLSRRERQVMDVIHRRGKATAAEVQADLDDPPSYSAVRALLRVLEEKGHVRHRRVGNKYRYEPTVPATRARRSALRHLLNTFFGDSPAQAMAAMLEDPAIDYTDEELDAMARMIREARKAGR